MTTAAAPSRETIVGTLRMFSAEILIVPTGLVTAAVLTRKLGTADYGMFAVAAALIATIEFSITSGLARTTFKFVADSDDWQNIATSMMHLYLTVGLAAGALVWVLAPWLAKSLHDHLLTPYLRLFAIDIPIFTLARAHRNVLLGLGRYRENSRAGITRWLTRMILIVLLVTTGFSVRGAIVACLGASAVEFLAARYYIRLPVLVRSPVHIRKLIIHALPLLFVGISMRLYDRLDLFLLQRLTSNSAVAGVYGAAQNITLVFGILATAFSSVLVSNLTRTIRGPGILSAKRLAQNAMRLVLVLLPLTALLAGSGRDIALLMFGRAFSSAGPIVGILAFAGCGNLLLTVATAILVAADKPNWTVALAVPMPVILSVLLVFVIPRYGAIGAAVSAAAVSTIGSVAALIAVRVAWSVSPPLATLGRALLLATLGYVTSAVCPGKGVFLLIKMAVLGCAVAGGFYAMGEIEKHEVWFARNLVGVLRKQAVA